jgi:asparagine synthase (glutamine-hydrolysing)
MCGIAGLLAVRPAAAGQPGAGQPGDLAAWTGAMAAALVHRGPDDGGVWHDPAAGATLASRRLAILDLSPEGHQPMLSSDGRWVLVHNGEVYNFRRLRAEHEAGGTGFRGDSDTEVVLAEIAARGLAGALPRLNGMWAMALWDRERRELTLVRDRLGQKPLYFGWLRPGLLGFASELKAFHAVPGFAPEIERRALPLLLRRACIPAPWSVYRRIWKLRPGHLVRLKPEEITPGADLAAAARPYWSAVEALERGQADPFPGGDEAAADALEELLGDAVELCMVSDVPLGALLSGGVDSSAVVALMARRSAQRVRTYSIGFASRRHDEAPHAARVAAHLGTEHTELYVTEEDALAVVPDLPAIYDEPFADSSQIPTFLVSRLARRHVTVALTGDGGDELFGGYPKYRQLTTLFRLGRLPAPLRAGLGFAARHAPWPAAPHWEKLGGIGHRLAGLEAKEKAAKLAGYLAETCSPDEMIVRILALWRDPGTVVLGAEEPPTALTDPSLWPRLAEPIRRAMAADTLLYLPDDVLAKVDRASMAVSLETRVPLLDHRVVELAARLPLPLVTGKAVLRRVLHRHVPPALVERPKMGFSVPLDAWLRGRLRDWAGDLLAPERLARAGFFDPAPLAARWASHLAGRSDQGAWLWPVLMFEAWRERWASGSAGAAVPRPAAGAGRREPASALAPVAAGIG